MRAYSQVPQDEKRSTCSHLFWNFLKISYQCWLTVCCSRFTCLFGVAFFVLMLIPQSLVSQWGNNEFKDVMQKQTSNVTGVDVQVDTVKLGLVFAEADITGFQLGNPQGYGYTTPFFMRCRKIHGDARWWRLLTSWFHFLELQSVTLEGLEVYIEQQLGVASNINDIMTNIAKNPVGRWAEDELLKSKEYKYIIDHIKINDMKVYVKMPAMPLAVVKVPPMVVSGIGMKENGVTLADLIGGLVQALSVSALDAEDTTVKLKLTNAATDLNKKEAKAV